MSDYFVFGDVNTSTFSNISVYFDSIDEVPVKDYELIEIPGRSGSFYLDRNRYEDVEHVYHIVALTKSDASNLINALVSKKGFLRLTDSYNTDEYYYAALKEITEPVITPERDKNTFKVIFTRKPQRFLTSGETAVTVANNGTLTNPTLFESSPLLEVKGYGNIGINGKTISVENTEIGQVMLANKTSDFVTYSSISLDAGNYQLLDTGDTITLTEGSYFTEGIGANNYPTNKVTALTTTVSGSIDCSVTSVPDTSNVGQSKESKITITEPIVFTKGTASTQSFTVNESATYKAGSTTGSYSGSFVISFEYQPSQNRITVTKGDHSPSLPSQLITVALRGASVISEIHGYSTRVTLTSSFYIDLDIGEAYSTSNNDVANLNNIVQLPAELPTLEPGTNTFTKDNTITQLKVTPRWWRV